MYYIFDKLIFYILNKYYLFWAEAYSKESRYCWIIKQLHQPKCFSSHCWDFFQLVKFLPFLELCCVLHPFILFAIPIEFPLYAYLIIVSVLCDSFLSFCNQKNLSTDKFCVLTIASSTYLVPQKHLLNGRVE